MKLFSQLPAPERADFIYEYATPRRFQPFIVEKDFWVCWLLGRIFADNELGGTVVFKGGTSLSKVFGAIARFSEDVDLTISPAALGWDEKRLEGARSKAQRQKLVAQLESSCAAVVETRWQTRLESEAIAVLGPRPGREKWFEYRLDAAAHSPILEFAYPQAVPTGTYIAPVVKLEIGSLTDQGPTGTHRIAPFVATLAADAFADFHAEVVSLKLERTFWEKATILHAEYHRPPGRPIRDRFARHYSDFATLWKQPAGRRAAGRLDLLERVRIHKSRYFASAWAHYETAIPGGLRLAPPIEREAELKRDYDAMKPMFLEDPPGFAEVLAVLKEAELSLNGR